MPDVVCFIVAQRLKGHKAKTETGAPAEQRLPMRKMKLLYEIMLGSEGPPDITFSLARLLDARTKTRVCLASMRRIILLLGSDPGSQLHGSRREKTLMMW